MLFIRGRVLSTFRTIRARPKYLTLIDAVYLFWLMGRVFNTTVVSLSIPEGDLFADSVMRLKNDRCLYVI